MSKHRDVKVHLFGKQRIMPEELLEELCNIYRKEHMQ